MKKYNIQNYIRYKKDVKTSIANLEDKFYDEYTDDEIIIKFLPLVENLARKFSTSDQASGVLSILDLLQIGNEALIKSVKKLTWEKLNESDDIEKTLKSFFSKRIKGAIRRRIDMNRGDIRIPEHKMNEIRKNPKDKKMVAMFFNNMALLNIYLKGLLKKHLNEKEYEVLRLSYGLDCDKHKAKEIATKIGITGSRDYVTVSEIKKQAVDKLIESVDHSQVIDYL